MALFAGDYAAALRKHLQSDITGIGSEILLEIVCDMQ